jgi:hypothetical protein
MAASDPYAFREMTVDDLPMVARWLATPEVVEWWGLGIPFPVIVGLVPTTHAW